VVKERTSRSSSHSSSHGGRPKRIKSKSSTSRAMVHRSNVSPLKSEGRHRSSATAQLAREQSNTSWLANELEGLAALGVGILLALALYLDALGPVGQEIARLGKLLIGWSVYLFPVGLVVAAILTMAQKRLNNRHVMMGGLLCVAAVSGLAALANSPISITASHASLENAGGYLGVLINDPISSGMGSWGSGVVLSVVLIAGLIMLSGVSFKKTIEFSSNSMRVALSALSRRYAKDNRGLLVDQRRSGIRSQAAAIDFDDDQASGVRGFIKGESEREDRGSRTNRGSQTSSKTSMADELLADTEGGAGHVFVESDDTELDRSAPTRVEGPQMKDLVRNPDEKTNQSTMSVVLERSGDRPLTSKWYLPPLSLLKRTRTQVLDERLIAEGGRRLVEALARHGVETFLIGQTTGPTVTRYELELGPGVKVAKVTSLYRDIAYVMASPDVRILAPIPGKSAIGVEVPNRKRQLVSLGDILSSPEAAAAKHPLQVAAGRDIAGRPVMINLAEMPHLLISGATGSGKSSCINSLITSVLLRATPDQVRLILIDPKRVELGQYNRLPHLLTQVVVDPKRAANALAWAVREMERRYDLLASAGMRDIDTYNAMVESESSHGRLELTSSLSKAESTDSEEIIYQQLPYVLVVVDELNDLMMVAARDVEESVCRLAQMARAVGIHLVLATQRPSVDVITGLIKANIPARLAFSVSSLADSRVILDQPGAERLIGKGDMLLLSASSSIPSRIQAPWVSGEEVRSIVAFWRRQATPQYLEGVDGDADTTSSSDGIHDNEDELFEQALELVVRSQLGSTSMLQRKLRIGFARAGRLMDLLERHGVVGPAEGSKTRQVLMTPEELDARH